MARARKMKAQSRSALSRLSGPLSWRYGRDPVSYTHLTLPTKA